VGGGSVGCECAQYLAVNNNQITVYELLSSVLNDADPITRSDLLGKMDQAGIIIKTGHRMRDFKNNLLTCLLENGQESLDRLDLLVLATGSRQESPLPAALKGNQYSYQVIGDASAPGRFVEAIRQAYMAVERLRNQE
jgi:pyruvate/2-oxoglutarate dehydrogenase complex dihydrolipoamide dehydrogenase (E3) component